NAASLITYSYDAANQLLRETQSVTGQTPQTLSYSYDLDGNRTGVQYPSGSQLGLGYNGRNLPASIVVEGTSMASFAYDGNGKRVSRTLENGITTSATYDTASRLTGLSSPVASYSYSLDSLGRRTTRSESTSLGVKRDSYAYDPISQLTGVNYSSGAKTTYAYDALGNRTSVTTSAGGNISTIPYLANACNQYTQIGGLLVSSDANGNLTSDQNGNTYSYDAQNRLVSARSGTNTMSVAYDAQNRVVSRTLNGVMNSYAYDGWNLIEDYDGAGNELARYIHGPQSDELLAKISPTGAVYYIQDGNQNVTTITDESGAVLERYTYDVYGAATITDAGGNTLTVSGVGNRFLFTGREYIAEIGLYDYRNRVYSASLGRFLQTDPIRFEAGDINIYRYVGNGPVNWRDPLGLWAVGGGAGYEISGGFGAPGGGGYTKSIAEGLFSGSGVGGYSSSGGFIGSAFGNNGGNSTNYSLGAYAGVGTFGFISNANTPCDLKKTTDTYILSAGIGPFNFSLSLSVGGGIWNLEAGAGPMGEGAGASFFSTKTTTTTF
ncbi:MAG: hypothetical protein EBS53_13425, partial [Bacteroidetes bacterium]|nr:hypothetical protein [Bacteroidota bacterium]